MGVVFEAEVLAFVGLLLERKHPEFWHYIVQRLDCHLHRPIAFLEMIVAFSLARVLLQQKPACMLNARVWSG